MYFIINWKVMAQAITDIYQKGMIITSTALYTYRVLLKL